MLNKKLKKINEEKVLGVAKKEELFLFYKILEENLQRSNFFNVKERKKITFNKIKNIFAKTKLSSEEIRILISIFKSLSN